MLNIIYRLNNLLKFSDMIFRMCTCAQRGVLSTEKVNGICLNEIFPWFQFTFLQHMITDKVGGV